MSPVKADGRSRTRAKTRLGRPRRMGLFLSPAPALELLDVDGTKALVLDAARRCMIQFGSSKLSMVDVARVAGVSRGSVYKYFPERDELVDAVAQLAFSAFTGDLHDAVAGAVGLQQQLLVAAIVVRSWDRGIWEETGGEILGDEEFNRFVTRAADRVISQMIAVLEEPLRAARQRGELRKGMELSQAAEWVARALYSLSAIPTITFNPDDRDDLAGTFVALLIHGIGG